jgi:hypothetical protein
MASRSTAITPQSGGGIPGSATTYVSPAVTGVESTNAKAQRRDVALCARAIKHDRPQNRKRYAGGADRLFGGELRTAIGAGRRRGIAFRQSMIRGRAALGLDRRDENEAADATGCGCGCQPRGGGPVDAIVEPRIDLARRLREACKMDDVDDAFEQGLPVEGLRQTGVPHHFDIGVERRLRRPPHGSAYGKTMLGEGCDHGAPDESGRAGYQDAAR